MDLRLDDNGVHLRLDDDELARLLEGKPLEQQIALGTHNLVWSVEPSEDAGHPKASFREGRLMISAPLDQIRQCAQSNRSEARPIPNTRHRGPVELIVEKEIRREPYPPGQGPAKKHGDILPHPWPNTSHEPSKSQPGDVSYSEKFPGATSA